MCELESCIQYQSTVLTRFTTDLSEDQSEQDSLLMSDTDERTPILNTSRSKSAATQNGGYDYLGTDPIQTHCHDDKEQSDQGQVDKRARRKLVLASMLCLLFMVGEAVGGALSGSLAILTDAAHLLTDFASFMISLLAIYLAVRPATKRMSFGWARAEVVGAVVSVLLIWVVTGVLVYLAVQRVISGDYVIEGKIMLITSAVGVAVNVLLGCTLHQHAHAHVHGHTHGHTHTHTHGHSRENINVRAAFIHVVGDFLQSLGVLTAAFVIYFKPSWKIADPICTFVFSILVLCTTLSVLKDALLVLMESAPKGLDFNEVKSTLYSIDGVMEVHNLRLWSLTTNRTALSAHLAVAPEDNSQEILQRATQMMKRNYCVQDVTIQLEHYVENMANCDECRDPKD